MLVAAAISVAYQQWYAAVICVLYSGLWIYFEYRDSTADHASGGVS
jgi:hypothetical protein